MKRSRLLRAVAVLALLVPAGVQAEDAASLAQRHASLKPTLAASPFGAPVAVESAEQDGLHRGDVYSVLPHPYALLRRMMGTPRAWCEIALLHLNIKACTHARREGRDELVFYSGRKFYEPPEKAYELRYVYRHEAAGDDYLRVVLTAENGPLATRDYRLVLEAIPLGNESFVHFRYAYRSSLASRLAMGGYLATLGSDKVGFSTTGQGPDGSPAYVDGVRGIVERNAMRYTLALQAYLDTRLLPETERRVRAFERWFDLTERWPRQLHELERADYLRYKQQELRQQLDRQRVLDAAPVTP